MTALALPADFLVASCVLAGAALQIIRERPHITLLVEIFGSRHHQLLPLPLCERESRIAFVCSMPS